MKKNNGIVVYVAVALAGSLAISLLLHSSALSVGQSGSNALILAAMWVPSLARLIATRTVDRDFVSPFPVRRWGKPFAAIIAVPLVTVIAIYVGANLLAAIAGVHRETPAWRTASIAANVAINLPLLSLIGAFGAFGEEWGWRGYLQPRLNQLKVPNALLWVVLIETAFHVPLILLAGYEAGGNAAISVALFFALKLGATPVWTWATYRWRTLWIAIAFHTLHNAIAQVLAPKIFGAGDPRILGEFGLLPVVLYFVAAAVYRRWVFNTSANPES